MPDARPLTPETQACCAHCTVKWVTMDDREGFTVGWWECQDCRMHFVPIGLLDARDKDVRERDRELTELETAYKRAEADVNRFSAALAEKEEEYSVLLDNLRVVQGNFQALNDRCARLTRDLEAARDALDVRAEAITAITECAQEWKDKAEAARVALQRWKEEEEIWKETEAQLRTDVGNLLAELEAHQENTDEYLEDEDAAVVLGIKTRHLAALAPSGAGEKGETG